MPSRRPELTKVAIAHQQRPVRGPGGFGRLYEDSFDLDQWYCH